LFLLFCAGTADTFAVLTLASVFSVLATAGVVDSEETSSNFVGA
jgi:hypothetical protein